MLRNENNEKSKGQSLVEFALMSFVFVLILSITVDFARVFSAYIMVGNMARAGAQHGSIANYYGAETESDALSMMVTAAYDEQSSIFGVTPMVNASIGEDPSDDRLCVASMTVSYPFESILPIPTDEVITISRTSDMRGQILDLCQ